MPAIVGRIAAEELVPRPVERVDVEGGRVLPGIFGVAVHFFESRIDSFLDALLKIDGGRNRGDRGKNIGVLVRHSERTLATHAHAQQRQLGRPGVPVLGDKRQDAIEDVALGGDRAVEACPGAVGPPGEAGNWLDHA